MSYIIPSSSPFISIKLTSKGRELLSMGQLTFSKWAIGDSELNYDREAIVDANPTDITLSATSRIMRPFDKNPNIKSYITPLGAITPFQPLNNSNISVIKAVVNNEAIERGFFGHTGSTYSTLTGSTFTPYTQSLSDTQLTGGTTLNLTTTSAITVGDIILIKLSNDTTGSITLTENTTPIPYLWFKVQSKTSTSITVDRNLPNYSGFSANSSLIVYRGGEVYNTIATGNTTSYWDSGTLSFDSSNNITASDVPVWNMNNVFCENLAGITGLSTTNLYEDYTKFGSYQYLGTKNPYLEFLCTSTGNSSTFNCNGPGFSYPDDVHKSISIIHYTNNTISSLYGEFFYIDTTNSKTLKIFIPDLMYHRRGFGTGSGTTMGMRFISDGTLKTVGTSDIQYYDLLEDSTLISSGATALAIGKVYPQLKIVVIHDDEIVAAMSYKSNRNWSLPALAATLTAPSGGTSTGLLGINDTIYLSYSLENTGVTGLTTSLPCQDYVKVTNNSSSAKDISFRISETDLLPYMRKIESAGYDGLGFYADRFKLIYQIVSDQNTRPDPGTWKVYDFTSTAITGTINQTINPKLLEGQIPSTNGFILDLLKDSGSTTFSIIQSLGMAANNSPDTLQFGDEKAFYGNLTTFIGAEIYKTLFDIRVDASQFNSTSNPTRSKVPSTNPPDIKISEIGVYSSTNDLVGIGKVSIPVALVTGSVILLELSLDF